MERVLRIWVARREADALFSCLCYFCRAESTPREPDAVMWRPCGQVPDQGHHVFDWPTGKEVLAKIAGHSLDFSSWPGSGRAELFLLPRCLIHIKAATLFGMRLIWRDTEPCHFSPLRIASLFARQCRGALCAPG